MKNFSIVMGVVLTAALGCIGCDNVDNGGADADAGTGMDGGIDTDPDGGSDTNPDGGDLDGGDPDGGIDTDADTDSDTCIDLETIAVSGWPDGFVPQYDVQEPCEDHRTCVECLPGPTGLTACKWCGTLDGTGRCISKASACAAGETELADHWIGYCPEFCDQMDGTTCESCINQPYPFDETCSWCPETKNCFNENASQVGLQPITFCAESKAGPHGVPCSEVPPYCDE